MASAQRHLIGVLFVSGLLSGGILACSSDDNTGSASSGGNGGNGSGSESSSGGSSSVASSSSQGGASGGQSTSKSSSKGGDSSGGKSSEASSSGGSSESSSSEASSGGSSSDSTAKGGGGGGGKGGAGGTGGKGGAGGTGGKGGAGGTGDNGGAGSGGKGGTATTGDSKGGTSAVGGNSTAGGTSGTTPTGGCQKGQVKGKEVVIFGESFYDFDPHYIQLRVEEKAKAAGALASGETYRNVSKSGQPMSYIANEEYTAAVNGGAFKAVIMDGGGIDCMSSSCPTCPDTFKGLLDKFVKQGVTQVIYTRYPEPGNPPGSNASLKGNLDALMPKMETVCKGYTGLKCYWVDLRPVWPAEKDKYTTDGLHPTKTGGDVVGDLIWAEMVKQCMAQ